MTLPRGFKANAEREALRVRTEMGLRPSDAIDIQALAQHLDVGIVKGEDLIGRERFEELESIQTGAFSAATFEIRGRKFIVTSPLQSPGRLASDIAHELSHVMLKHELSEIREVEGLPFRTCKPDEEEQATAFGGTLLLPRDVLLAAARKGLTPDRIATAFNTSIEMAKFRYNTTGVQRQIAAGRRR